MCIVPASCCNSAACMYGLPRVLYEAQGSLLMSVSPGFSRLQLYSLARTANAASKMRNSEVSLPSASAASIRLSSFHQVKQLLHKLLVSPTCPVLPPASSFDGCEGKKARSLRPADVAALEAVLVVACSTLAALDCTHQQHDQSIAWA